MSGEVVRNKLNIYQRLHAVALQVEYVKREQVPRSGTGVYRDMVVAIVRPVLLAQGIYTSTSQIPGSGRYVAPSEGALKGNCNLQIYAGSYTTRFVNIDDPADFHEVTHEAQANDFGDKAPGKAATYAEKLNIIKGLMLETGIADEGRNPGEGDGAGTGTEEASKAAASSDIKAPQSKSGKAEGKAADKADPDDAKPASKGLIDQIKGAATAKGAEAKVAATFEAKELSYETLTRGQAKAIWKYLSELPDAAAA